MRVDAAREVLLDFNRITETYASFYVRSSSERSADRQKTQKSRQLQRCSCVCLTCHVPCLLALCLQDELLEQFTGPTLHCIAGNSMKIRAIPPTACIRDPKIVEHI